MNQNIVNEEVNKYVNNLFRSCDKNNKGYLTMEEFLKCENENQENESQSEIDDKMDFLKNSKR